MSPVRTWASRTAKFAVEGEKARRVEDEMFDHIRAEHPELLSGLDWKQHTAFEHRVRDAIQSH